MWFMTLIVLAIAAFLIIKAVKAASQRQSTESTRTDQAIPERSDEPRQSESTVAVGTSNPASGTTRQPTTSADPEHVSADSGSDSATAEEIREMIKTLNLAHSDAPRLGISAEQFNALRYSDSSSDGTTLPDEASRQEVARRLRRMLN